MRRSFHDDLKALEGEILFMGGLAREALLKVLAALQDRDEEMAQLVEEEDDAIDQKYVEIEQRILGLLARQAPVAGDLRLVSAMIHINIHIERMGDLCVNMSKFVALTRDYTPNEQIHENIQDMGEQAINMIDAALLSFEKRDLEIALNLPKLDDPIDRLNKKIFKEIAACAADELMLDWASRMALVSRYIERIGDHAVDIGEQVGFVMTGEIREFDS